MNRIKETDYLKLTDKRKKSIADGSETLSHANVGFISQCGSYLLCRHDDYERLEPTKSIYGHKDGPITKAGGNHIVRVVNNIIPYLPYAINIIHSESVRASDTARIIKDSVPGMADMIEVVQCVSTPLLCESNKHLCNPDKIAQLIKDNITNPYACLIITHQPNMELFSMHLRPNPFKDNRPNHMDMISEKGICFRNGLPV